MKPKRVEALIRTSPGRPPQPYIVTLDAEGITFRQKRHRTTWTLSHSRALHIAVADAVNDTPST